MSNMGNESRLREIITKAVCGNGRKFTQASHTVTPPNRPTSILGAWIINHQYEAVKSGDGIEVVGTYDINLWYSYDKNSQTDVAKETVSYSQLVPLSYLDPKHKAATVEVSADVLQEPNCIEARINSTGDGVTIRVEREFEVEMVAETKMWVKVYKGAAEEKDLDFYEDAEDIEYDDLESDLLDDELN